MTSIFVKLYRRTREKLYKGPISVEITCGITNMYGIVCPDCWHDLTSNSECELCVSSRPDTLVWKAQEISEVFGIPFENLTADGTPVFVP